MSAELEDLYDMSDEELEAAFKTAKAQQDSPETDIEEQITDEVTPEEEASEEEIVDLDDEVTEEDGDEYPDNEQDSDHDASEESDEDADLDENSEEDEDGKLDGEPETEETDAADKEAETKEETQPVQQMSFKANGKEYQFTEDEIKEQFPRIFGQAMDYTKKMQAIKPYRKTIDAIEQAGLKHEDVNLAIDVLKGDKDAIAEVLKRTGVDTLDLDTEESRYEAKDYGRDETTLAVKDIVDRIAEDVEFGTTRNILEKQWDESSWKEMSGNPELIELLHIDVKNGVYANVQPLADKMKLYDGGKQSDLEYYKAAGREYLQGVKAQEDSQMREAQLAQEQQMRAAQLKQEQEKLAQVKAASERRNSTKAASKKRKAAAPTGRSAGKSDVVDYMEASDEEFENWRKKLEDDM